MSPPGLAAGVIKWRLAPLQADYKRFSPEKSDEPCVAYKHSCFLHLVIRIS
jgi:hypothetical protein